MKDIELKETQPQQQQTTSQTHHPSRYNKSRNGCLKCLEKIRWKINLFLLFRPFSFFACFPFSFNLHKYIYEATISELLLWFYIIYSFIPVLQFMKQRNYFPYNPRRLESADGEGGTIFQFVPVSEYGIGNIAIRFFILTYIFGTRNSLHDILFGLGFERAIVYHKWFGICAVLFSFFHGFGFGKNAIFNFGDDDIFFGAIATWFGVIICISGFYKIRRNLWEIFLKLHWILFIIIFGSTIFHGGGQLGFAAPFVLIDWCYRIYMSFFNKTKLIEIISLPGNVIRIKFNKESFKYEPGQYVFICFPAISLTEWHPFSLSTNPESDNYLMIHARVLGDWTKKLYDMALKLNNNNSNFNWNTIQCYVNGPYGQLTIPIFNYSTLILISGGIGITPLQSIFNDIIIKLKNGEKLNYTRIKFIWSVRDPSLVTEFGQRHWAGKALHITNNDTNSEEITNELIKNTDNTTTNNNDDNKNDIENNNDKLPTWYSPNLLNYIDVNKGETVINGCTIITEFYLTRVKNEIKQNEYKNKFPFIKFGRPNISDILVDEKRIYKENGNCFCGVTKSGNGIASLCCGPQKMVDDVMRYSSKYGIDCHYEMFDF